jgi:Holliday junction resolvase RusA-like endonuclease
MRVLPDRRPRFSLWITGRPKSQRTRAPVWYVEAVQAEARKQVQGAPLSSSKIDVEIIFATRGAVLDVDNAPKRILDTLKGIVYDNDAQIRTVKSVGLRLDQGFLARGSPEVYKRLLSGKEFLVNIYEGERETDVYLVDANTPETERPSLVMLAIAKPAVTESPATAT